MCYKSGYHSHWGGHHHKHFRKQARKRWRQRMAAWWMPPVNIEEQDDHYTIYLYAAGYAKEDFQVRLEDDTLLIAVDKGTSNDIKWRKQEFYAPGFERYFELNDKVDREKISAKYEEGILKVTLPKLEGAQTVHQDIDIV